MVQRWRHFILLLGLLTPVGAGADVKPTDGQHDFDFEIGSWKTHLKRLVRGEFVSDETLDGRPIRVRFVLSDITPTSCRFEQAFSDDGGKTWEVNWIATDTRVAP